MYIRAFTGTLTGSPAIETLLWTPFYSFAVEPIKTGRSAS